MDQSGVKINAMEAGTAEEGITMALERAPTWC